jgi:uncharacterized protein with GYD domain
MTTYICLANWTQKGIENVKDSPNRLEAAKKFFGEMGVELKGFYMTSGRYDLVLIVEAPNDTTLAKTLLAQATLGGIRTETLRAYTEGEYRDILGSLP